MEPNDDTAAGQLRTLMRGIELPPTRLDPARFLPDAHRSQRRRRAVTALVAAATGVAVAVPASVLLATGPRGDDTAPPVAPSRPVNTRTAGPTGQVACSPTALPWAEPGDYGFVFTVDPTGRHIIGSSRGGVAFTVWTDGVPRLVTIPDSQGNVSAVAVNSAGVWIGYDQVPPPYHNWVYRNGAPQRLPLPSGYESSTVVDINQRGDVIGSAATVGAGGYNENRGVIVWPADAPASPRIINDPELTPLDIRDDGTIIAVRTWKYSNVTSVVAVIEPDGTIKNVPIPKEADRTTISQVDGDYAFGSRMEPLDASDPSREPQFHPVRWNLRTGQVEVFTGLPGGATGAPTGWMVASTGSDQVIVDPRGEVKRLTGINGVAWIKADGRTLVGDSAQRPTVWRC
jgi:hypothetical protein